MTPRERILHALDHRETPHLPIDFASTRSSGIQVAPYRALRDALNLPYRPPRVFDVKQALADPDEDVLLRLRADARPLHRLSPSAGVRLDAWKQILWDDGLPACAPANYAPVKQADGSYAILDAEGRAVMRKPAGGLYFDDAYAPLAEAEDEDIDRHPYPVIRDEDLDFTRGLAEGADPDYARVYSTGMSFFERGLKDFGYEEYLVRLMTEEDQIRRYLDHLLDSYRASLDRVADAFGPRIDVLQFNDDLGNQLSALISPEIYRRLIKPAHAALFAHAKKRMPQAHILLHSCGCIRPFLDDLIEAGVHAINPVQYNAAFMEPSALKRDFGRDLTFWGGAVATQTVLTFGTPKDVADEARRMIDILAPGGGFVFNQVHNIQTGIPPEKVIALYDTAIDERRDVPQ